MDNKKPIVSVCCIAYNQAPYIRKCLDGIMLQKTNFLYEVLVHDDASTDGTAEIIREYEQNYSDIIKPIYQTVNQFSQGIPISVTFNFPRVKGKYVAFCEGDDYWIDPDKLQKQVDFLEANPDYGLVHTELDIQHQKKGKYIKRHWESSGTTNQEGDIYENLLCGLISMVHLCTVCFRSEYIINNLGFENIVKQNFLVLDTPLVLYIALNSRIGYMDYCTAVRNILKSSFTQGRSFEFWLAFLTDDRIFDYFNNIKPVSKTAIGLRKQKIYSSILNLCYSHFRRKDLFENYYSKILNIRYDMKIKRFGMGNKPSYFISRLLLKMNRLLIDI